MAGEEEAERPIAEARRTGATAGKKVPGTFPLGTFPPLAPFPPPLARPSDVYSSGASTHGAELWRVNHEEHEGHEDVVRPDRGDEGVPFVSFVFFVVGT